MQIKIHMVNKDGTLYYPAVFHNAASGITLFRVEYQLQRNSNGAYQYYDPLNQLSKFAKSVRFLEKDLNETTLQQGLSANVLIQAFIVSLRKNLNASVLEDNKLIIELIEKLGKKEPTESDLIDLLKLIKLFKIPGMQKVKVEYTLHSNHEYIAKEINLLKELIPQKYKCFLTDSEIDIPYFVDGQGPCEQEALMKYFEAKKGEKINPYTNNKISEFGVNEALRIEIALFFKKARYLFYFFDGDTTQYTIWKDRLCNADISYEDFKKEITDTQLSLVSLSHWAEPIHSRLLPCKPMFDLFLKYQIDVFKHSKKDIYTLAERILIENDDESAALLIDLHQTEPYLERFCLPICELKDMLKSREEVEFEPIDASYYFNFN